jgi:hypothetical protein
MQDIQIKKFGRHALTQSSVGCYLFETTGYERFAQPSMLPFYTKSRRLQPITVEGFKIIPSGENNYYPDELREILDENNLTPEILNKQAQLLWGQGPHLYKIDFIDGKRVKVWVSDPTIEFWLDTWDYKDYLLKSIVDFRTTNGHWTKYHRNIGARIPGRKKFIAKLSHHSNVFCRLEWPDDSNNINNIIVGDFSQPWRKRFVSFPVFNREDPFLYPVSMRYSNMYSYALENEYSRAPFHGTINWIKLSSSIAKLLSAFNLNSAAIKYHIQAPAAYWQEKEEMMKRNCELANTEYTDKMLEDFKDDTFRKITEALSGTMNVGKIVNTDQFFDENSNQWVGWKIEVLDQKVKDFIDAQINIARRAALDTTSGLGLHPALSNLSADGNLPSGSEQLYAFKLYLATGVDIPEEIVTKDINMAIKANFPETNLRLGFYHENVLPEKDITPSERIRNQAPGEANNQGDQNNQNN